MRRHVLMWWAAGGATLLGATLTYVMSRPALAPVVSRAQAGATRVRDSRLWEAGTWVGRKLADKLTDILRKDRGGRPAEAPVTRNAAFEEYRAAELTRLEHEEREFAAYLERLRAARDREEFENFMRDRRAR